VCRIRSGGRRAQAILPKTIAPPPSGAARPAFHGDAAVSNRYRTRHLDDSTRRLAHFLFRLTLTGTHFPERGAEPFVRIGELRSRFVEIAPDGLSANAYFDTPPGTEGVVEFGYDQTVLLRCARRFDIRAVGRLRKALLPAHVRNLDRFAAMLE
jgi:hypothetical protein